MCLQWNWLGCIAWEKDWAQEWALWNTGVTKCRRGWCLTYSNTLISVSKTGLQPCERTVRHPKPHLGRFNGVKSVTYVEWHQKRWLTLIRWLKDRIHLCATEQLSNGTCMQTVLLTIAAVVVRGTHMRLKTDKNRRSSSLKMLLRLDICR